MRVLFTDDGVVNRCAALACPEGWTVDFFSKNSVECVDPYWLNSPLPVILSSDALRSLSKIGIELSPCSHNQGFMIDGEVVDFSDSVAKKKYNSRFGCVVKREPKNAIFVPRLKLAEELYSLSLGESGKSGIDSYDLTLDFERVEEQFEIVDCVMVHTDKYFDGLSKIYISNSPHSCVRSIHLCNSTCLVTFSHNPTKEEIVGDLNYIFQGVWKNLTPVRVRFEKNHHENLEINDAIVSMIEARD